MEYGVRNKRELRKCPFILCRFFCSRWPGLAMQVNSWCLVRECLFASWSWDKFPTIREKVMKRFEKMLPCGSAMKAMGKRWAHESYYKRWALHLKNWSSYIDSCESSQAKSQILKIFKSHNLVPFFKFNREYRFKL